MIGNSVQVCSLEKTGEVSFRLSDALRASMGRKEGVIEGVSREEALLGFRFSASGLGNICPRLYAMAIRDGVAVRDGVDADTAWTLAVGTGFHRAFQDEVLATLGDVYQGAWEPVDGVWPDPRPVATFGPHVERGWYARPKGDKHWRYREPRGFVPSVRLVGKWDGVLAWPDAPHEVFELKTIRADLFSTVDPRMGGKPRADHVLQCQAYMWMSGLCATRLVYLSKGQETLWASLAEHVIHRDDAAIAALELDMGASLGAMAAVLAGEPLPPPLSACRIKSDPRAKRCVAKAACFEARNR